MILSLKREMRTRKESVVIEWGKSKIIKSFSVEPLEESFKDLISLLN